MQGEDGQNCKNETVNIEYNKARFAFLLLQKWGNARINNVFLWWELTVTVSQLKTALKN